MSFFIKLKKRTGSIPALQEVGGSFCKSLSSFKMRLEAIESEPKNQIWTHRVTEKQPKQPKRDSPDEEKIRSISTYKGYRERSTNPRDDIFGI